METLTTAGLPATGRLAAWNALYASRMSRVGFLPEDRRHFAAELRIGRLGPVRLARLSVDRCSIERSPLHIVQPSLRLHSFVLQTRGQSIFHHCGHEARLDEGDFVLCDTAQPHYWSASSPSTIIMVRVEPSVLREHLPAPEQYCGRHLARSLGLTPTVGALVRSLAARAEGGIGSAYEGPVGTNLLKMIALNYLMSFRDAGATGALHHWHSDIIRHVDDHLRDPGLTPASIAKMLGLSPRYLRTIFSISGERLSAYILRRRLDECARQLRSPAWNAHTLAEIAFSWGFNSPAYFTRCFRDRFGDSPLAYRRAAQGGWTDTA